MVVWKAEIRPGTWFIVGGQKAYVAEMGEVFANPQGKSDARLRVIFDNGTESNLRRSSGPADAVRSCRSSGTHRRLRKMRFAIWSAMPATANMVAKVTTQNPMRPTIGVSNEPSS